MIMLFSAPFDNKSPRYYRTSNIRLNTDISVLEIGYNRMPHEMQQIMQRDVYILHYITSGKGFFLNCEFDETCGYLVTPNELEIIYSDKNDPYECYWIMFRGALAPEMLRKCGLTEHNHVFQFNKNKECSKILQKTLFEIEPINEFSEACKMQAAFYEIIAIHTEDLKENSLISNFTVQNIADFLQKNFNQQLKINDLAEKFHYSRNYLFTLFKREYGVSPQEYLLTLRIKKAKQLLSYKDKNISVKEVSFAVGFEDPLYFSRIFRKRTGVSPTEFKNSLCQPD